MKYLFQVVQTQITIPYRRILRTLDNRIGNIFFLSNSDTNYCNVLQILSAVQQITTFDKIFEVLKLPISNLNIYIGAIRVFFTATTPTPAWVPTKTWVPPTNCGDSEFPCYNGECIYSSDVCDGTINCSDGSDEDYCNSTGWFFHSLGAGCNVNYPIRYS